VSQLEVDSMSFELCEEFHKLNLRMVAKTEVREIEVGCTLLKDIRQGQLEDEKIVTPSFKVKTECIPLCVTGSIFTHKVTNSEINSITSVYYNVS
jgi:hypothetical protein